MDHLANNSSSSGSKVSSGSSGASSVHEGRRWRHGTSSDGQGGLLDSLAQAENSEGTDGRRRVASGHPNDDIVARLALAQHELLDDPTPHSSGADSEESDSLRLAQRIEDELERRSSNSSMVDSHDGTSKSATRETTAAMSTNTSESTDDRVVEVWHTLEDSLQPCEESSKSLHQDDVAQPISHLEEHHAATTTTTWENTAQEPLRVAKVADDRHGEVLDKTAGVKARMQVRVDNIKAQFSERAEEAQLEKKRAVQKHKVTEETLTIEKESLENKLAATTLAASQVVDERDVLRRNLQIMQRNYQEHVGILHERLLLANQALRNPEHSSDSEGEPLMDEISGNSSSSSAATLQEKLAHATDKQRTMADGISELRLHMLSRKRDQPGIPVVGDLTMMMNSADVRLQDVGVSEASGGGVGGSRGAALGLGRQMRLPTRMGGKEIGKLGRPTMSLACIEEDPQSIDDSSGGSTGNVSSDSVGEVEDFEDIRTQSMALKHQQNQEYEQKIKSLQERLINDRAILVTVQEEMADKEAAHTSKVSRLMETLYNTESMAKDQLEAIREEFSKNGRHHQDQMEELQARLEAAQKRCEMVQAEHATLQTQTCRSAGQRESEMESLRYQLVCALEGKRIAEGRVDELNRAMASMERRHKEVVARLKLGSTNEQSCKSVESQVSSSGCFTDGIEELRDQLRGSNEERNVLVNSLEWKEVQWKSNAENMEMQHGLEISELKRKHEEELKAVQQKLEGELAKQLEDAQSRPIIQQGALPTTAGLSGPVAWLASLRCPVRNLSNLAGSPEGAAFCQDICWQTVNAMHGTIALLCNGGDYKIMDATRAACMTWGSAALQGRSVLTLVNGPSRAAWLRRAFQMHQRIADSSSDGIPGFVVRDLGCEKFTAKTGQTFESSVITAHLPSEPRCGNQSVLLVIIKPQGFTKDGVPQQQAVQQHKPAPRIERSASAGGSQFSTSSEISSVYPDDSASNIAFQS